MTNSQTPATDQAATAPKRSIQLNDQILFNRPNSLFVGRVVTVKEKAVRVDYDMQPISARGFNDVIVYHFYCWIPISVLVLDKDEISWTVKKWYAEKYNGGHCMRGYILSHGRVIPR